MGRTALISMNLPRHIRAHVDLYGHIVRSDLQKTAAKRYFYDEYFAVSDLPGDFYLETVQRVFQEYHLPRGIFEYRGAHVNPAAIRKTALLTIEGELDDICSIGQTVAAHELCTGIKPFRKKLIICPARSRPLRRLRRQQMGYDRSIRWCAITISGQRQGHMPGKIWLRIANRTQS